MVLCLSLKLLPFFHQAQLEPFASPHSHIAFLHCQLQILSLFSNTSIIMLGKEKNLHSHSEWAQEFLSVEKPVVLENLPVILSATFQKDQDTYVQGKEPTGLSTLVKGTVLRISSHVTLLLILQVQHSKITTSPAQNLNKNINHIVLIVLK